jgi:DNA invertase Pin-like site-specific DNA recombinase
MSDKIKAHHLERKAVLYVRQSSPHQVLRNEESRRLQYSMMNRVKQLGWTEVEVLDEDLGRSAAGGTERAGFERMVAEVCLGKVGSVAAREVSRFARNSRDWQQLVEVCRMVDTLLIDQETIYDPRRGNDRLLLGLKGSLNEYELDILRLRSLEARREKARRGELIVSPPAGFIKTEDERLVKEPDLRVQEALERVFQKFLELGTARQTLMWFLEYGLELPVREYGALGWETVWKRPTYQMVLRILTHPFYGGIYAHGRSEVIMELSNGRPCKKHRRKPRERWLTLIYDHHEGYIDGEQYNRIQEMIRKNSQQWCGSGAAKGGSALLSGLLRCRRCSRKLLVSYNGKGGKVLGYVCRRGQLDNAEPRCISFGGLSVDDAVSREVLRVVRPGAIEAAIEAAREVSCQQNDVIESLDLELEAACYTADRARKQYDAVDPENRLVADELERRWNVTLEKVRELEERIEEEKSRNEQIDPPTPEAFRELAEDLDLVWNDPKTDVRLKKRILRALIHEVIVDTDSEAGEILLVIHWKGGVHTELRVRWRRRGQHRSQASTEIIDAIRALALICSDKHIASYLNRNKLRTGRGNRWTQQSVTSLRKYRNIDKYSPERKEVEGWMNLTQAASYLVSVERSLIFRSASPPLYKS